MTKGCHFTGRGTGRFPFDMLRYDRCFPATSESAIALHVELAFPRNVLLFSDTLSAPTVERWRSFGWSVETSRALKGEGG